jgi:putative phosphoesterase
MRWIHGADRMPLNVGVLSDTHGLLRPEVLRALEGSHHILHAGDVGDPAILDALRELAPVTAIRGNIDRSGACAQLPATEVIELGGCVMYVLHSLDDLDVKPESAGLNVVLYGHSHQPAAATRNGVLYLNPGSCGPRRFSLPVTVARLRIADDSTASAEIISLLAV